MWFFLLLYTAHVELVIVHGEDRLILKRGNNPCEGHIEIYHNDELGFVGDQHWDKNIEKVVCSSTHCGKPVKSSTETVLWPINKVWLNELNCSGSENHLWDCKHPGWSVSFYQKGHLQKIKCSNEIKIDLDGYECAGAGMYSTDNGKTNSGYFCADGFGKTEADLLCKNLNCGTSKEIPQQPWMVWKKFETSKKMKVKCSGIKDADNLWQCATQESPTCQKPASVICTGHERLQLRGDPSNVCSGELEKEVKGNWIPVNKNEIRPDVGCQQMHCGTNKTLSGTKLTCTDNVKIVLMDENKPSTCYGAVYIEVNNSTHPVCGSDWDKKDAEVVCRELNCGSVISQERKGPSIKGIMENVNCSGSESSLWHCRAKRDKNTFQCGSSARVVCAESMEVRLIDGPGRCAGRVEVQYEGQWKRVSDKKWTESNSDVVCRQLNCGNRRQSTNPEKFGQGSGDFLAKTVECKKNSKKISDCIKGNANNQRADEKAVGITCEEHKVVFLKGDKACSGMVGIEHSQKTYWLSGSDQTWKKETANTVCRQMHCGEASSHNFTPRGNMAKDVWNESYNCSSNATSLFDCEKGKLPLDHNSTIATVTCSGKIEMNLTNGCWGTVTFCMGRKCGGVCADAWTPQKSVMLCKNLGCGNAALKAISKPAKTEVIFKSLHTTNETTKLTQCNFVRNDENDKNCDPAYVVCSGSVKSKIESSRDKCSGNVEVYYEGQWLPVCTNALKKIETQNTICGELNCGEAGNLTDYFGPESTKTHVISNIECSPSGNKSVAACVISSSKKDTCTPGGLQCATWKKMKLTAASKACSGAVSVLSKEKTSSVSIKGWTETEGDRLCQDLKCGKFKSNETRTSSSPWTTGFSCADIKNPENIWDCEKQTTSSQKEQLYIECEDEPNVTLSKRCHGEVRINGIGVCASHWKDSYSKLVCQQQRCSNAIPGASKQVPSDQKSRPGENYHHVRCEDNHFELGQCKTFKGTCNEGLVSVYCVGDIKFNITEKCGGQIEVNYRDKWEKVCPLNSFPQTFKDMLCKKLGCGGYTKEKKIANSNNNKKVNLETTLSCTNNVREIKHCVHHQSCEKAKPAEIYCDGYEEQIIQPQITTTPMPIILGVGFLLLLVIVIVVFIRIRVVKKAKNAMNVSSRMLSRKEVEFESGDYEDVTSKGNEMDDFNRGTGFRSQSEVITENDAQSTSSFPYDDIDMAETQPLTSQADAAGASGDNYINQVAPDESADGVPDEVDDPQENYDDVEASPEITETEAEVHQSPQTAPESDAAPTPELAQGDEDYLVPGQDG